MTEAIYIPGKTAEEVKAERARKKPQGQAQVQLDLTLNDAVDYEKASSNMEYLLSAAGDIFDMLHCEISMGNMDTHSPGVISMLEMVGRGFCRCGR
jgi:hypothetical protein